MGEAGAIREAGAQVLPRPPQCPLAPVSAPLAPGAPCRYPDSCAAQGPWRHLAPTSTLPPCHPLSLPPSGTVAPFGPNVHPASLPPCLPASLPQGPWRHLAPKSTRTSGGRANPVSRGDSEEAKVDPRPEQQGRPDEQEAPVPPAGTRRRAVLQLSDGCAVSTTSAVTKARALASSLEM